MMIDFKFRVGEEVICEGDFVRTKRSFLGIPYYARITSPRATEGFVQERFHHEYRGIKVYRVNDHLYAENCLRRKFRPGDSFDTLMTNLKNPKRIEA